MIILLFKLKYLRIVVYRRVTTRSGGAVALPTS